MTSTDLTTLESEQIERARLSAAAIVARAHDLDVSDAEQAERAGSVLRDLATVRKRAESERLELTKPLRDKQAAINANYKPPMAMLDEADKVIRGKVLAYRREQERLRAIEQARLDAIAEEQRKADEAAREAAAAIVRVQQEQWAAEAKAREEADDTAGAEAAREAAEAFATLELAESIAPLPVRQVEKVAPLPKASGVSTRKTWTFEIVGRVPKCYWIIDEAAIRRQMMADIKATGAPLPISGVEFKQEEGMSVRSR